jgi:hypothetical protein
MMRLSSVFWILLVSATALATFAIKYQVQALDDQLTDAKRATASAERELRVLNAEWAYLNRPDMLAAMNAQFLSLVPITQKQLQTKITDIPMRPAPAAPPVPQAAPTPPTGLVAAADTRSPAADLPAAAATPEPTPPTEKLAMASAPINRAAAMRDPPLGAPPRSRSFAGHSLDGRALASRALDSRSLDQLISRIAGDR